MTRVTVNGVSSEPTQAFEIIRSAADAYLSSEQPSRVHVSADQLYEWLTVPPVGGRPLVVDVRAPEAFSRGHIPDAVNMPGQHLLDPDNLTRLPQDRTVVLVGGDGHMESQLVLVLNMLEFDARVLRYGMPAWTRDRGVAPRRFVQHAMAGGYPVSNTPAALPAPGPLPALEADTDNARSVILAAARACLEQGVPAHITAEELRAQLSPGSQLTPFVLSVRKPEHYALGHIPDARNFYYVETAELNWLPALPPDRLIVVYCYIGHTASQAAMLLRMLGYQVTNLAWGLAGWTPDESVAMAAFKESEDARDYPLET